MYFNPFVIFVLAIFIFYFIIFIFYFMYLAFDLLKYHWFLFRSRSHHIRSRSRNHHRPAMVFLFPTNPSHTTSSGLDPTIMNSFSVFTFSSDVTHMDLIDCAVCLSEFEEGELGRVLPGCKHAFHVECIDMWFHSHSTCPLCRSLVEPLEEQVSIITIPPESVSATEPGSISVSRSSTMSLEGSPMSRMVSFTRMLSRDQRIATSSLGGAPSHSPSSTCGIVLTESDVERRGEEIK